MSQNDEKSVTKRLLKSVKKLQIKIVFLISIT